MDRGVLVTAVVAFSFALGCGRSAQEPAKPTEPAPAPPPAATAAAPAPATDKYACPTTGTKKKDHGKYTALSVGPDGNPEFACLDVKLKKTTVVWIAEEGVAKIEIAFKNPVAGTTPDAPAPGPICVINRKDMRADGEFDYRVTVTLDNGEKRTVDPRLIINP
jgi:hypothetical protein